MMELQTDPRALAVAELARRSAIAQAQAE